ncbi:MAG TPA: DUF2249 domain-containing protein [Gemmatimonadaceae bacterium]
MRGERDAGPIVATDLVSDVLARSEALVEIFVRHSPLLEKLRNRAMRRVMARLVSVEQAARMARVPLEPLLRELNAALSPDSAGRPGDRQASRAEATRATAESRAHVHPPGAAVVELDVRDDLRSGREPFSKIMAAIAALPRGGVLRLRAIFEPVPLFGVLAKRGFVHEVRQHAVDDWSVWFWREEQGDVIDPAPTPPAGVEADAAIHDGMRWLDVRGLEPPEPLVRTLAALETLRAGEQLVQINVRVPQFLLPMLAERGYACEVDDSRADRVLVRIWRSASA